MATINVHVSDELLAELQSQAQAEGKSVDEVAEAALRRGIDPQSWQDIFACGLERGRASGYTEDVPRVVRENRRRHR